jgi:hypothetical protein
VKILQAYCPEQNFSITFKFVHEVAKVQHGHKNVNLYQFWGFLLKAVKGRTLVTWSMLSRFSTMVRIFNKRSSYCVAKRLSLKLPT